MCLESQHLEGCSQLPSSFKGSMGSMRPSDKRKEIGRKEEKEQVIGVANSEVLTQAAAAKRQRLFVRPSVVQNPGLYFIAQMRWVSAGRRRP